MSADSNIASKSRLKTDVNESFLSEIASIRLENLFESEKQLAELRHKHFSEVSGVTGSAQPLHGKQGSWATSSTSGRSLKEVESLRHRLSDEVSEHLEREAAAAQAAREDLANLAKELRLEMKSLRSDLLKIQEQLTSEKGDS